MRGNVLTNRNRPVAYNSVDSETRAILTPWDGVTRIKAARCAKE